MSPADLIEGPDDVAVRCAVAARQVATWSPAPCPPRVHHISTRPALSTLPSWTPRRADAHARRGNLAAPRTPRRVERLTRPGTHLGGGVPGQRVATWVVVAGAAVMPVLLAVQIWRGTR